MRKQVRTVLELRIQELRQTQEEFAEYATAYARTYNEPGTLSARHLQRLVAGRNPDGSPIGPPRPSTVRLLERIFGQPIENLLASPGLTDQAPSAYPLQVAIAIVRNGPQVLMVSPRAPEAPAPTWQFPAGIVKPGLSAETVAVRETLAETAVRCTVERSLGNRVHPMTNVFCEYFLCSYLAGDATNLDAVENADVMWIEKDKLTDLVPSEQVFAPVLQALDLMSI